MEFGKPSIARHHVHLRALFSPLPRFVCFPCLFPFPRSRHAQVPRATCNLTLLYTHVAGMLGQWKRDACRKSAQNS
jgi:hypothetical protein